MRRNRKRQTQDPVDNSDFQPRAKIGGSTHGAAPVTPTQTQHASGTCLNSLFRCFTCLAEMHWPCKLSIFLCALAGSKTASERNTQEVDNSWWQGPRNWLPGELLCGRVLLRVNLEACGAADKLQLLSPRNHLPLLSSKDSEKKVIFEKK